MFLYGNGFNTINHREYHIIEAISDFIIDETQVKVGHDYFWIWMQSNQSDGKTILGNYISSSERNMLIAERFLNSLINKYGKHNISTDGDTWYLSSSL